MTFQPGAAELALEFLDDLAVAAHRAVQALQVAVDDEDQVVELLARCEADGAHRFDFVHFAVAAEHPDLAVLGVGDAAGMQVFEKARLVDGHQWAEAHRHRGKLPELGHQLRMRIARQALAVDFLAEVEQLLFGQAAFKVGAGVDAGGDVALDVEAVAAVVFALGVPEVVEASAEHVRQRGKGADVAAEVAAFGGMVAVGLDHHRHGIPAHVGAQALFDLEIAGAALFLVGLDGVDVRGIGRERLVDAVLPGMFEQLLQKEVSPLRPLALNHGGQGIHPFTGFLGVRVIRGRAEQVLWICRHACLSFRAVAVI
jgi:hypothetical protein